MNIEESTLRYESWMRRLIPVVDHDLAFKHSRMKNDPFSFFRATFYRWSQLWTSHCMALLKLPKVLSVGDLHVQNFGTWRDSEGRLIWGVNDFDEAIPLPFAQDLVRLTVSAFLAAETAEHKGSFPDREEMVAHILAGYWESIEMGGEAFVLAEHHAFLLKQATASIRQPNRFWPGLIDRLADAPEAMPETAVRVLRKSFPSDAEATIHVLTKPKGLGSLGRRRYVATASWRGGFIAREIKDTLPSAFTWAHKQDPETGNRWLIHTVESAIRAQDPFYQVRRNWLVRRLAPDCSRIELGELGDSSEGCKLLQSMGHETANIHLGSPQGRKAIRSAAKKLPPDWLMKASTQLLEAIHKDFHDFKSVEIPEKS